MIQVPGTNAELVGVQEFSDPLMHQYLDHVRFEKRLAQRTCELYIEDLKKLSALLKESGLSAQEVTSADIRRWLVRMHSTGRTPRGIALILSGWRGFYSWLGRFGHVKTNPVVGVKSPKVPKPLPKALSVDDAVRLAQYRAGHGGVRGLSKGGVDPVQTKSKVSLELTDEDQIGAAEVGAAEVDVQALGVAKSTNDPLAYWLDVRDAAIVELLYGSGLRVGELVGLDLRPSSVGSNQSAGWIDLESSQAHVLGKGSKRRSVPVGSMTIKALKAWIEIRGLKPTRTDHQSSKALFIGRNGTRLTPQSIWQRLKGRSLQAGISTPVHPHMLRHSFASHLLQSSSDLRGVQEMLGHANIATTQVYTRLDFQHLAKAYDAAHPRAAKKNKTKVTKK